MVIYRRHDEGELKHKITLATTGTHRLIHLEMPFAQAVLSVMQRML